VYSDAGDGGFFSVSSGTYNASDEHKIAFAQISSRYVQKQLSTSRL